MAELSIRLLVDPATGQKNVVIGYESDADALPLALSGHLAPWLAAAGMTASSLVVVLNAMRLHRGPERSP